MHVAFVETLHERLRQARERAGFETASDAARALGLSESTYLGHENGSRGFKAKAEKYARRFGVSLEWLLTGKQIRAAGRSDEAHDVPLVGFVGPAAQVHFFEKGRSGSRLVRGPVDSSEETVALEVRGDGLGALFDRWLLFYDATERPIKIENLGKPCVVQLPDGSVLVRKVRRSKSRGLYHLLSQTTDDTMLDVAIDWAAPVKHLVSP
jgi:transcriptional regulator with XRE-family HTH domain